MKKIFIIAATILFGSFAFLSCGFGGGSSGENAIVYGENEISIQAAAGASMETIMGANASEEKPIFESYVYGFMGIDIMKLMSSPDPASIIYVSITENLIGEKIDMKNFGQLANGSMIHLAARIDGEMVLQYILASDGEHTEAYDEAIKSGTFQLERNGMQCTLAIDAEMSDGTTFSCHYDGNIITTGIESIFKQFLNY